MSAYRQEHLDAFHQAAQTLKLYRRAELEGPQGDSLIEALYVDPLPNEHIYKTMKRSNTTFIIGRKGTGKSTVFQRAQRGLLKEPAIMSTYIDIKTVYESAQVSPAFAEKMAAEQTALPPEDVHHLLLLRAFLRAVVAGLRDDMAEQLKSSSWIGRLKDSIRGTSQELFAALDEFLEGVDESNFLDVTGLFAQDVSEQKGGESQTSSAASVGLSLKTDAGLDLGAETSVSSTDSFTYASKYSSVLLRSINVKELIARLRDILTPLGVKHLMVFVDDFSELPEPAMVTVVDVLLAPLNNWSDELIKFKVAAYPGRIYYGAIDKSKIDEVSLDMFNLYGGKNVAEMEAKAIDFTRRLVETRLRHFGVDIRAFVDSRDYEGLWRMLFYASLGNPRTLGYVLFFLYESALIYDHGINATAIRDASRRFYEEKLEPYFGMGRFLHESFDERSSIYSLKELLERIVVRARELRYYERSAQVRSISGRPPTSHFHVPQPFDPLLSSLELNFFVTKYYVMSDRDGRRVSVYALNHGLCQKYSLEFGRPGEQREHRLYFVERIFDYGPIMQDYIASNQEISCSACGTVYDNQALESLRLFHMLCPQCKVGTCSVTNVSRRYAHLLEQVDEQALLPRTELGILQALGQDERLFAGDIAAELDVSPQLVGWRGKKLAERQLVERRMVKGRREFEATEMAKRVYFSNPDLGELQVDRD